jgi:two-component system chemotaxis response regulator CheB
MPLKGLPAAPARSRLEMQPHDTPIDVIAIGASAGGVEALTACVRQLPAALGAAVLVVMHIPESGTSVLPAILGRSGPLPVTSARDGESIEAGHIYVCPPGHHLTVEGGTLHLLHGPRENGHRPAVDPLFRSVAHAYGPRAAGVVLSGARDDGTAGLGEIKLRGGIAIVQNPEEALYAGMPRNAMTHVEVDAVLPLKDVGFVLARLAGESPQADLDVVATPGSVARAFPDLEAEGRPSRFTCPDCGGVLYEYNDGTVDRFACNIGHAYSFESLFDEQAHRLESSLWAAIRSLEDRALLLRRMELHRTAAGSLRSPQTLEERARDAAEAQAIRDALRRISAAWIADEDAPAAVRPAPTEPAA